jgi:hypothetical protein
MGPLVPELISNNMNFIVAFIIGIFFGAILEQAGFSTSKKLVGLFYGYDFTVLRVFFTAGLVAMVGVMALDHLGLIDINLIYINPTFLTSAIVGGVIMGLGFVVGGFCPGTSICAASIGKIDAMIFVGGAILGVIIFGEGYPIFENLYMANNMGSPQMFQTLGISQGLFAFLFVVIGLASFWFTSIIENKVNGIKKPAIRFTPYYLSMALIGVLLALSAFVFTDRKTELNAKIQDMNYVNSFPLDTMNVDEFALCVTKILECDKYQGIDFRSEKEQTQFPLPKAVSMTENSLFEKNAFKTLSIRNKINIFIADDELTERKMAIIATELGYKNIRILRGGLNNFISTILNFKPIENPTTKEEEYTNRFRLYASQKIPQILKDYKPLPKSNNNKPKRIVGGC